MEAIRVCGSGLFFEREVEFFGMSMSTDWERDDGVVYTGSINLMRSWTTTGRYGTFLSKTHFFFLYCNSRQNQSRTCQPYQVLFLLFIKPPVFLPRITIID